VDVSKLTSLNSAFSGDSKLETISGLEHWNTSRITDVYDAFAYLYNFSSLDLSHWDMSHVQDMNRMFESSTFEALKLRDWTFCKQSTLRYMLYGVTVNGSLDLSGWD
ncbi:BspA family leucine-rich repeat surface protein, partial [Bifidobacterium bombi]|uniref:BspA family leucine-rich repeat surface protein n=1 Tax=Bifidobacterium bombi TaxID=471511 RepID=UPI000A7BE769